jgi:hypothetical protein
MKIFNSVVLSSALVTPGVACDLCSVYSANQARGEIGKGPFVGVAEQFTHFGTLQESGHKVPNELGQYLDSSISQVFVGYNFKETIGVQLNLPVVYRSFRRAEGFNVDQGTESGIGDLSLIGHVQVYRKETKQYTFGWNVLGGVKFPTGSTRRLNEELNENEEEGAPLSGIHGHDLTLGSGSFDGIIGTGIFGRWKRAFLTANIQYMIRTTGDIDYRFANDLTWSGGPGWFIALQDKYTVALQLVASGEDKGMDTFGGEKAEDTGITSVYLGPQVTFTWSDQLSAEVAVDLPVYIQNTAFQAVPDYRVRAGVTWHF